MNPLGGSAAGLYTPQSGAVPASPTVATPSVGGAGGLTMKEIQDYLDTLTPEEQEAFLRNMFRDYEGETKLGEDQRAMAASLRDQAGPEGRSYGGVYRAANPLEHLASAGWRVKGARDYNAAEDMLEDITKAKSRAAEDMARVYLPR